MVVGGAFECAELVGHQQGRGQVGRGSGKAGKGRAHHAGRRAQRTGCAGTCPEAGGGGAHARGVVGSNGAGQIGAPRSG